jgi:hypothetical protein
MAQKPTTPVEAAVHTPMPRDATASEAAQDVNYMALTHPHDIERFHRLGKLPPEAIAKYQKSGQLPTPPEAV